MRKCGSAPVVVADGRTIGDQQVKSAGLGTATVTLALSKVQGCPVFGVDAISPASLSTPYGVLSVHCDTTQSRLTG